MLMAGSLGQFDERNGDAERSGRRPLTVRIQLSFEPPEQHSAALKKGKSGCFRAALSFAPHA
jgi:hypothetical protein